MPRFEKLRLIPGVYLTFEEVAGRRSTLAEFRALLREFHRDAVVHLASLINQLLFGPGPIDKRLHDAIVERFMPPHIAALASRPRGAGEPPVFVYHQQQLIFLAKEALFICHDHGRLPPQGDEAFALLFLMASDQFAQEAPVAESGDEKLLAQVAQFFPIFETTGSHRWQHSVFRPALLLNHWRRLHQAGQTSFDPDELFLQATGIPIEAYFGFTFAVIAKSLEFNLERLASDRESFGVDLAFFKETIMDPAITQKYLDDISLPSSDFSHSTENRWIADYTCFRRIPAVRRSGRIYPVDFSFLAGKCDSALFWKVNDSFSDSPARDRFHEFWGQLFECYANSFLDQTADQNGHSLFTSPTYADHPNEQVCDAIVICGSEAVLVEYKANMFKIEGKYSGDWRVLQEDIEKKLVGTLQRPKGIRQLAIAVQRVFSKGERVADVDLSRVRKVFPLLVTLDSLGGAAFLNTYLVRRFRQLFGRPRTRMVVTPTFSLSAEQFEILCGHLSETRITELLEARYRADRDLRLPFHLLLGPPEKVGDSNLPTPFRAVLDEIYNMVRRDFFGVFRESPSA